MFVQLSVGVKDSREIWSWNYTYDCRKRFLL